MKERERLNIKTLSGHLKRFFGGSEKTAASAIEDKLVENEELSRADIFHIITDGKGSGKSHSSGKREGEVKRS